MPEGNGEGVRRHFSYANVMSTFAVFLVLAGGTAMAATINSSRDIAPQSVKNSDIKKNNIKTNRLKDGRAVGDQDVIPESLTGISILDESLTAAELGPNSVGASELQDNSVNSAKVANNTLDTNDIANGGLNDVDVGISSGVFIHNQGNVPANTCLFSSHSAPGATVGDHVVVTNPDSLNTLDLSTNAGVAAAGSIRLNVCNGTNGAIDPPGGTFSFLVINQ